jgi:stage II sporulation protein AA (anti-sigma F factor antagonist)
VESELQLRETFCVVRLKGRFQTGSNADYLRTVGELERTGARTVVLDCSELERLDSTGLAFVVGVHNALAACAGRFALVNTNPRISEILRLTRLERVLPVFDSVHEAAAAL